MSAHGLPDDVDRRRFLRVATLAGAAWPGWARWAPPRDGVCRPLAGVAGPSTPVLNLLLNVGYLLAEFSLRGPYGQGLEAGWSAGRAGGRSARGRGGVRQPLHRQYAEEIRHRPRAHVRLVRGCSGRPGRRPELDLDAASRTRPSPPGWSSGAGGSTCTRRGQLPAGASCWPLWA